ncbi:hypothetical protein VP01_3135g1, partial [Puccinia sorghi]
MLFILISYNGCGSLKPQAIVRCVSSHMWLKKGVQVTQEFEGSKIIKNYVDFSQKKKNVQYIHTVHHLSPFNLIFFFKIELKELIPMIPHTTYKEDYKC